MKNTSVLESLIRSIHGAMRCTAPHMLAHTMLSLMFSRFLSGKAGDVLTLFYISMTHDKQRNYVKFCTIISSTLLKDRDMIQRLSIAIDTAHSGTGK